MIRMFTPEAQTLPLPLLPKDDGGPGVAFSCSEGEHSCRVAWPSRWSLDAGAVVQSDLSGHRAAVLHGHQGLACVSG